MQESVVEFFCGIPRLGLEIAGGRGLFLELVSAAGIEVLWD
jgi:hypothetical protein